MGKYGCLCRKPETKYDLEKLKKRPNESIMDFSTRWNEKKAKIVPLLDTSDLAENFVKALELDCGYLVGFTYLPFTQLAEKVDKCEKFFKTGRLNNHTTTHEFMDQIQAGASRKAIYKLFWLEQGPRMVGITLYLEAHGEPILRTTPTVSKNGLEIGRSQL